MAFQIIDLLHDDSRGNRVQKHIIASFAGESSTRRLLCLSAPEEAVYQIESVPQFGTCSRFHGRLTFPDGNQYNHALEYSSGVPSNTLALVELLKDVLTLRLPHDSPLDFATALDFYKLPEPGVDPMQWENTTAGAWVNWGKYRSPSEARRNAVRALVDKVTSVFETHPLYVRATAVLSVPGHKADGRSFGERFARHIAKVTDKTLVEVTCPSGPREQRKGGGATSALPSFAIDEDLSRERIVIVDDVFRSGRTMAHVAETARTVGAKEVSGFVIARTLSN
ncbi:phosphoribosyltransferase [Cellulosimicrobium cellulans]